MHIYIYIPVYIYELIYSLYSLETQKTFQIKKKKKRMQKERKTLVEGKAELEEQIKAARDEANKFKEVHDAQREEQDRFIETERFFFFFP